MRTRFICLAMMFVLLCSTVSAQWVQTNGPYGGIVRCLAVPGTNLFAGTGSCVFLSTNNGTSWTEVNTGLTNHLTYHDVESFAVSGTNLLAGTGGGGVFLSTNNGTSWTEVNTGLTFTAVRAFAVSGTNLFAGAGHNGVWRRPLSEMITAVESISDLPTNFTLEQNYPNPFNPATTISFSLPRKSFVSLKVFDALGRQVAILFADELSAGTYSRQWNAAGLASGVYFYRLQAGSLIETKKMLLLK